MIQKVVVLYSNDSPGLTIDVIPVAGEPDAIMTFGRKLCRDHEDAGQLNMDFVLTTFDSDKILNL